MIGAIFEPPVTDTTRSLGDYLARRIKMPQESSQVATDRRPRLALIVTDVYAFNVLGRGQLEFFADQGVDLDLYCGGSQEGIAELRERDLGRVTKLKLHREPRPFWDLIALAQLIVCLTINRYDGVVFSTPKAMLLGALAAAIGRQRYRVALVRGRAYENYVGIKRRVFVALDRLAFALAHRTVFISYSQHQAYIEDGLSTRITPSEAVPGHGSSNGVDITRFKPQSSEGRARLRRQAGFTEDDFVIVVVGRIAPDKGAKLALRLMREFREDKHVKCVFVGNFEDKTLRDEIYGAKDLRIRHHPACKNVEDWFGLADLNFMPTSREGFGNVAIEAAASGVLTVAFNVVGLRDSVNDPVSGRLFEYGDVKAIEHEIRLIVSNREKLREQGMAARNWAATHFAQETVWRNYLGLFLPRQFG